MQGQTGACAAGICLRCCVKLLLYWVLQRVEALLGEVGVEEVAFQLHYQAADLRGHLNTCMAHPDKKLAMILARINKHFQATSPHLAQEVWSRSALTSTAIACLRAPAPVPACCFRLTYIGCNTTCNAAGTDSHWYLHALICWLSGAQVGEGPAGAVQHTGRADRGLLQQHPAQAHRGGVDPDRRLHHMTFQCLCCVITSLPDFTVVHLFF